MTLNRVEELERFQEQMAERLPEHGEVFDKDFVILHSVMSAAALDHTDIPSILVLHGGMRENSSFFEETVSRMSATKEYFVRKEIDQVRAMVGALLEKPDIVAANSRFVQERTKKYYGVDSRVIYPPIDTEKFSPVDADGDYYLSVQRMVWYKRPEVQIEAFKDLDEKLVMVGKGELDDSVKKEAAKHDNIEYRGYVSDEELVRLYSGANATIQTAMKEDFGYIPREGLACGTPAITGDEGGFSELFQKGDVGKTFDPERRVESLKETVREFEPGRYDSQELRKIAVENYSHEVIREQFRDAILEAKRKH